MSGLGSEFSKEVEALHERARQEAVINTHRQIERASRNTHVLKVARALGPIASRHLNEYDHLTRLETIRPKIPGMWAKNKEVVVASGWLVAAKNKSQYQEPAVNNMNNSAYYKNHAVLLTPHGSLMYFWGFSHDSYMVGTPNGNVDCAQYSHISDASEIEFSAKDIYDGMVTFAARTNIPT
ncbi:MAG: hypothetical protein U5K77_02405 [Candidatus Saccharibacteria bacterium]|nr:hypothetical protein [Candidatus Saccharibacteria bacterium]